MSQFQESQLTIIAVPTKRVHVNVSKVNQYPELPTNVDVVLTEVQDVDLTVLGQSQRGR